MSKNKLFPFLFALLIALGAFAGFRSGSLSKEVPSFRMLANGQFKPGDTVFFQITNNTEDENFQFSVYRVSKEFEFISEYLAARTYGRFDIWKKDGTYLQFMEKIRDFNRVVTPSANYYYDASKISAGIFDKPGIYVIRGINSGKVAWLPVYVSDKMMVVKKGEKNILSFTMNATTGEILSPTSTSFYSGGKKLGEVTPGVDGLSLLSLNGVKTEENAPSLVTAMVGNELVYSDPYIFFGNDSDIRYYSSIFTNQPVYRPGAVVSYKGIIRFRQDGEMGVPSQEKISVKITDPTGTEVSSEELMLDEYGSFWSTLKTTPSFKPGTYYITAKYKENWFSGYFSLEEYKKPEFKVDVAFDKGSCFNGEQIKGTVKAGYYFGQPVSGGTVKVRVLKKPYRVPWWLGSEYAWYYKSWYNFDWGNYEYVKELTGQLNADGEWSFNYQTPDDTASSYTYTFEASVTDASMREIKGASSVTVSVTDLILTAGTNRWFVKPGNEITISANAWSLDLAPVEKELAIIVNKTTYINDQPITETVYRSEIKTDANGVGKLIYKPEAEGSYNVVITARGSNGRLTATHTSFNCFNSRPGWYWWDNNQEAQIFTDKDAYLPGDTIKVMIYAPGKPKEGVVTVEQNSILKAQKISLNDGYAELMIVTDKNWFPGVNISFAGVVNSDFILTNKKIGVINDAAKLNVQITPAKKKYKPGEEVEFTVKVTGKDGKPVKGAQIAFGTVDESIYAIKQDNTPSLYNSFYPDEWYYTQTTNSIEGKYSQSMSRPASLMDTDYKPGGAQTGNSAIEIKLKFDKLDDVKDEFTIMVTNGTVIRKEKWDGVNFTKFKGLPAGEYDICFVYYNIVFPLKRVYVGEGKTFAEEIYMEPYHDEIEFYFSGNMAGGMADYTKMDGGATKDGAVFEKAAPPDMEGEKQQLTVRENFVDAPYWNPAVVTDGSGEANVAFNLPDNLTSWRSTVRVITKDTRTGETINNVIAAKDLMIRLETPRFFKETDTTTVIANIHNYLPSEANTKVKFSFANLNPVSFEVKGVNITKKTFDSFEANIPSKGVATVEIKTAVPFSNFNSEIYVEAISDKVSDAVRISVPVIPVGIKAINYLNTVIQSNENEKTMEFNIPAGVNLKTLNLSLAVSPTIATSLLNSLDGLVDYPYGCVEQTMSRFLPALITSNALKKLGANVSSSTLEKLPDVIEKGLSRLYDFQNQQGGWGWWKNDPVNPYMTAYVMYGLDMAIKLGYKVDPNVYKRGLDALGNLLRETNIDRVTAAYIAWVYSSLEPTAKKNPSFNKLTDELLADSLSSYATALLGLTYHNIADKSTSKAVLERLMKQSVEDQNFIHWGNDNYYTWQNDKVQATAFALKFMIAAGGDTSKMFKAMKTLIREQKGRGWHSTLQTAIAVFALTDYVTLTNELDPEYTAEVFINGKPVRKVTFDKANLYPADATINLNHSTFPLIHGKNTIRIVKKGKGILYAGAETDLYYPDLSFIKENRFTVTKEIYKLNQVRSGNSIVYRKGNADKIMPGDMLLIKLKVKTNRTDDQYMMVEDMLPAGFEMVKDDNLYNIEGEQNYTGYWPGYWTWFYADKEIRDSKITFFVTYAPQEMEFTYILKAQLPGFYSSEPTYAGLMYYPEIRGFGNKTLFRILPQ